ncbi:YifB family Mg chelatase-like AAA ATPase [Heliorestis acidaminivorans]|uniref:YifB family Mg chelatase-like AAA ATPase n=1 Tax=Heliorestis acidaminivorans TaxID=553427 RepID=A0A6I0EUW9_9FIRM|nr:YifB family Mg chelatase-like AAA ATPase [Heliorestis acidaminivorans]KAB2951628.1 YifB family Mg chelatase-like AAA ATPase [Heliorestis acidaminivorans]
MTTVLKSFAINGIDGYQVEVEISTLTGQPSMAIVGLGDTAVKEAKQRIESALITAGYEFPKMKIVINLAPGDIKKSGTHFDLPMAVGLLNASKQIQLDDLQRNNYAFLGELSLNGQIRPVKGVLPMAIKARQTGLTHLIVPTGNIREAQLVEGLEVLGFSRLERLVEYIQGKGRADPIPPEEEAIKPFKTIDFRDVLGQELLIESIVLASAGGHNMLMSGTPGCGKSMIAKRIPTILPELSREEALEVTKIYSVAGFLYQQDRLITERPFRSPHHNASLNALVGGGSPVVPGEISLAHHGVLFLDEIAEYSKKTLDAMRQPIEDKKVTIARVRHSVTYPCNFMLVAAMNPCPCGYFGQGRCRCSDYEVLKYRQKISGPILDRIDIQKNVRPVNITRLSPEDIGRSSEELRQRVQEARKKQQERFAHLTGINCNAQMNEAMVKEFCPLQRDSLEILQLAHQQFEFSARTYHKLLKIARTSADLDGAKTIEQSHILTALSCREMDKEQSKLLVV